MLAKRHEIQVSTSPTNENFSSPVGGFRNLLTLRSTQVSRFAYLPAVFFPYSLGILPLKQAEHVPLEDELEALCRLHATRAKLVLSGDLDSYSANASMLDEFSFCDDDSTSRDAADGNSVDGASVSSASQPPGVGANSRQELDSSSNTGVAIDPRRRRLAAVNNCLDAFDRSVLLST